MTLLWTFVLAVLLSLSLTHGADEGVPRSKKRQSSAGGSNTFQHPLQALQGYSSEHRRQDRQGSRGIKTGLLSHRSLHPLGAPEDDGPGLEGMSPVRVEMGPVRERDRGRVSHNNLLGTRKGRGHGNGQERHMEHRRHGGHKGKHGKGSDLSSPMKDKNVFEDPLFSALTLPSEPPPPAGLSLVRAPLWLPWLRMSILQHCPQPPPNPRGQEKARVRET